MKSRTVTVPVQVTPNYKLLVKTLVTDTFYGDDVRVLDVIEADTGEALTDEDIMAFLGDYTELLLRAVDLNKDLEQQTDERRH